MQDRTKQERGIQLALKSPVRRSAMRLLNGSANPVSTEDLAAELAVGEDELLPQLHVLREFQLIEMHPEARGSDGVLSSYWTSVVRDRQHLSEALAETDHADAGLLEARRQISTGLEGDGLL